ncbi:hypothetical protein [Epilithonimonas lactis]|nr:hypothetical protein [Epilithonimonas lactis]SEP82423.1 hypothetical protein SAMN04488097_0765 [Epilithonimonas lactis]
MKLLNKIRLSAMLILSAYVMYAQGNAKGNDHKIIDSNPIHTISGNGILNVGTNGKLSFSGAESNSDFEMTDSAIKAKKDGIYRFTLNTNLATTERKQKDLSYYVNLNGKEAFSKNQRDFPSNGEFYFQIQLKANDLITFNVKGSEEINSAKLQNTLKVEFTDPQLMRTEEE